MSKPQRRVARKKQRLAVRYGRPGEETDRSGITADISPMGLFVNSCKLEKVGQILWLLVNLPDGEVLLRGEVVWQRSVSRELWAMSRSGFGIRLIQAPEEWYHYFYAHPDFETAA
jgi:hypothetical protein